MQSLSWLLRAVMPLFFLAEFGLWITGHTLSPYSVNDFPPTVTRSAACAHYSAVSSKL